MQRGEELQRERERELRAELREQEHDELFEQEHEDEGGARRGEERRSQGERERERGEEALRELEREDAAAAAMGIQKRTQVMESFEEREAVASAFTQRSLGRGSKIPAEAACGFGPRSQRRAQIRGAGRCGRCIVVGKSEPQSGQNPLLPTRSTPRCPKTIILTLTRCATDAPTAACMKSSLPPGSAGE